MRSPFFGTASREHNSPKIPTSASHGTSIPTASSRARASASATHAASSSVTLQVHWRAGVAKITRQVFVTS